MRNAAPLFSKVQIMQDQINNLEKECDQYFAAKSLFVSHIIPTTWTIGKMVPNHAQDCFDKCGFGLGIVTMRGRESKHVQ